MIYKSSIYFKSILILLCLNVYCKTAFPKYIPTYLTAYFSKENKIVVSSHVRAITYKQFIVQLHQISLSMQ